ncbi:hypothetical protein LA080_000455 [Diaporthe eres]|nr:hypothetical protein LA080_000455 [Diaporthe eres]
MASDRTVDFGSFSIASKVDKDFALNVSTSMSLSLPEHFADHLTAEDLRDQHPAGVSVHGEAQRRQLAIEAFQSLPIWGDLGLELRLELNVLSNRTPSTTSVYHIQHTQQHSGLFVPQHVPCGYLSEFSCSFRYVAETSRAPGNVEESVPRSRIHTRYNFRKLAATPTEPPSVHPAAFWGLPPEVQAERLVHLTNNALNLMLEPVVGSGLDKVLDELHRRIQILLLRSARDQKIKTCLPRVKAPRAPPPGLALSQEGSSVPDTPTGNDFTNFASLDLVEETLYGQDDSQSHEPMSGLPDHGLMHLESGSSYGFATYRTGSAESDGIDLAPEEDYMDTDMEVAEWIDDNAVSYMSESLPEYGDLYNEYHLGDEILDLTYSEQEYQEQHLAPDDAHQEYDMNAAEFYDESDCYGHYHEMPDIEGGVQPTAHDFEDSSAKSDCLVDPGDDYSDFVTDEDKVIGDGIYEHLCDDDTYYDEGPNDAWEINDDYVQGDMLHRGDLDQEADPDYLTAGYVHHNDQAEAAESNMRIGRHGRPLQYWSQVPRNYVYHGTEEQWAHPGLHPIAFTSRLADYQ